MADDRKEPKQERAPLPQTEHVLGAPSPEERDTPLKADEPADAENE